MFDIAKIFNRKDEMIQIPIEHLCANELNLCYKKKGYPYLFTEAKVCMALYLRWQSLKNGEKAEFTPSGSGSIVDKENQGPNAPTLADDKELQKQLVKLRADFEDPSVPVKVESDAMVKFLIKDAVKSAFDVQMRARLMKAQNV